MFDFYNRHLPVSDSNLKVLKQDDKTLKVQCLCAKAHVNLEKRLKPYLLKHKNNKQRRTTKMDTFTLATRAQLLEAWLALTSV